MTTIGDRIRILRKAKGLTQEQLAEMGDITKSAVSQWESDSTMPTTAALLLIRTKVEFSIDWLLFDSGDPPDGDQRTRHLIEMYQQLDERGKAAVFRTAEAESSYTVSDADLTKRSA